MSSTGCYFGCSTWTNKVAWFLYGFCMLAGFVLWVVGLALYMVGLDSDSDKKMACPPPPTQTTSMLHQCQWW